MLFAPGNENRSDDKPQVFRRRGRATALALTTAVVMTLGSAALAPAAIAVDAPEAPEPASEVIAESAEPALVAAAAIPVSIDVVTINDFHGRIEANGAEAGAAVLAGAVQTFRTSNPNTVFAAAGDLIGASTFTSFIQEDNPTIDALNAAGLEVSAAGNHEFDQGWADLRDRVQARANWEYLSANVVDKATGAPVLASYWVKEMEGVRVGFIGAVTEELHSLVPPAGIADLRIDPIVDSVNRVAANLTDGDPANNEADVIVLLVHEGAATVEISSITPDSVLGKIVNGVDSSVNAIVSAHTHLAYNHVIDGRPVVSAGDFGKNIGLMNIQVDPVTKELLSISNQVRPLAGLYPAVEKVQAIVDDASAIANVLGAAKVGDITADFNRARQSDGKSENRGGESTIGNFVADVHRWATGTDIALMNPGGIRANLTFASSGEGDADGNVSFREAANVQPFANSMVKLTLTGAQLKQVLEEQWQPESASRAFLKLGVSSNLSYTYDPSAPKGSHITAITLNGAPLDLTANYTVAANGFLAGGGDNFTTLAEGTNVQDAGISDLQTMVDWFKANGTASPDLAQRAVGVTVNAPAGEGFAKAEEVTLELSSLAFSAGEQQPTGVTVSLNGKVLATSVVDLSVVDATDEAGRATLRFATPAGITGTQTLLVETQGTGTKVLVPVVFAASNESGAEGGGSGGGEGTENPGASGGKGSGGKGLAATGATSYAPLGILAALMLLVGVSALAVRGVRTKQIGAEKAVTGQHE